MNPPRLAGPATAAHRRPWLPILVLAIILDVVILSNLSFAVMA